MTKRAHNFKNLSGLRFGKWLVIEAYSRYHPSTGKRASGLIWLCECSCGNQAMVVGQTLTSGRSTKCQACKGASIKTHGMSGTRVFQAWKNMIGRCRYQSNPMYKIYGGRGIAVCARWLSFSAFLSDMGEPPHNMSLDRINPDGDYQPDNCRWATPKEQSNNRRDNVRYAYLGEDITISQLAEAAGIKRSTLAYRLKKWGFENAISIMPSHSNSRRNYGSSNGLVHHHE